MKELGKGCELMGNKKVSVFCPLCEKKLLKTMSADEIEMTCPRCHVNLQIRMNNIGLMVKESSVEYKAG